MWRLESLTTASPIYLSVGSPRLKIYITLFEKMLGENDESNFFDMYFESGEIDCCMHYFNKCYF